MGAGHESSCWFGSRLPEHWAGQFLIYDTTFSLLLLFASVPPSFASGSPGAAAGSDL